MQWWTPLFFTVAQKVATAEFNIKSYLKIKSSQEL